MIESDRVDTVTRRVLIALSILAVALIFSLIIGNLLGLLALFFVSILFAIFLRSMAEFITRKTKLSYIPALILVMIALAAMLSLGIWGLSTPLWSQFEQLGDTLPRSFIYLREELSQYEWGDQLFAQLTSFDDLIANRILLIDRVTTIFTNTIGFLVSFLVVTFLGVYLAVNPTMYTDGLLRLIPIHRRERIREVIIAVKRTLQWWLIGRALSMIALGFLVTFGLWIMQVPLAPALGILAAFLDFVPHFGPLIATIPAVLIALTQSPLKALAVLIFFIVVQQVESFLITPFIQQKTTSLPPGLAIVAQVLLVFLLGPLGLLIASPLAVALLVVVRMLYVEDILGDKITNT